MNSLERPLLLLFIFVFIPCEDGDSLEMRFLDAAWEIFLGERGRVPKAFEAEREGGSSVTVLAVTDWTWSEK